MDAMFRKSMGDLVRGIRANKNDESKYINKCLQDIKEELKLVNKKAKTIAIQKLTYLHMMGYDMSWASFNVVEVMSYSIFTSKRIGYLAASQCFSKDTEVAMLTTSLFRKDIGSVNMYETSIAVGCLSTICTPDLSRDLAPDIVSLLSSSRPYLRKRAVLCLYKICLQFPQALRPAYPRLKEKLEDADPTVVCAAVNVICELARKNPKNYLTLAPILFKILTMSTNNWMLIKIIKLFGSLTPLEKRLGKKLVEPLTNIMNSTSAMSLLYECIQTCIIGLSAHASIIRLCVTKLRMFLEHPDQNLKYLGLKALHKLMGIAPKAVQDHKDTVLKCLDDEDTTIRISALDLLQGMVTKRSLIDIAKKLLVKIEDADGEYQDHLVETIIDICSQNNYQFITDFEWYVSILVELSHVHGTTHGKKISDQLMDVCIRVSIVREYCAQKMVDLLNETRLTEEGPSEGGVCEVLYAAAWIAGEYAQYATNHSQIVSSLLQPRISTLPGHIQAVHVQNALKIYTRLAAAGPKAAASLEQAAGHMKKLLPLFTRSPHLETQERACFAMELVNLVDSLGASVAGEMVQLFAETLNPVAPRAQRKVPVPAGLDLDAQIHTPPPSDSEDDDDYFADQRFYEDESEASSRRHEEYTPEEKAQRKKERKARHANDPYYLGSPAAGGGGSRFDIDCPEVEQITPEMLSLETKKKKPRKAHVMTTFEMPEGAGDDSDEDPETADDPFADIDFSKPVKPEEELQVKSYPMPSVGNPSEAPSEGRRSKKSRRRKDGDREDRKSRRRDKDRDGRKKKKRGDRREDTSEGDLIGISSAPPAAAPAATTAGPAGFVFAASGPELMVGYVLAVNPSQPDKILATFHVKGLVNAAGVNVTMKDTINTKVLPAFSALEPYDVPAGTLKTQAIMFQFQSFAQPQKLQGKVSFKVGGAEKSMPLNVVFPCSAFVRPVAGTTQAEFNELASNAAMQTSSLTVKASDPRKALELICNTIHVGVVNVAAAAFLFGRTTLNQPICVGVQNQSGNMTVTMKCADASFGNNLLAEVKAAFP